MRRPWLQMTLGHLAAIVAIVAVGMSPSKNSTRPWLGLLMYVKFGLLVAAVFLARYGRSRDWWFGFAALGVAYLVLSVPGLWYAVYSTGDRNDFDVFDLTGSAGRVLARTEGDPAEADPTYVR